MNTSNCVTAQLGDPGKNIVALACDKAGVLYGVEEGDEGNFYTLDKTDGTPTRVAATGVSAEGLQSMAFHHITGKLF